MLAIYWEKVHSVFRLMNTNNPLRNELIYSGEQLLTSSSRHLLGTWVWTQTQKADGTQLRLQSYHSANASPSCLEWEAPRMNHQLWDQVAPPTPKEPGHTILPCCPFFLITPTTDQYARRNTPPACQDEWGRGYSVIYNCHDDFEGPSYLLFPITPLSPLKL